MKSIERFWIYGNKYAVMDSYYTIRAIGSLRDMEELKNKLSIDKAYGIPFSVVKLTDGTSKLFEAVK